jgi:nitroimidazol reductase NimA-like FMN-containing flavoprotein (pyridoxamine 5'-phosphate oxidase superfamily)
MAATDDVVYLLQNNWLMTIATANTDGKPWVSPVGYVMDDQHNFYWVSDKDALHSRNIRQRPEIAISIVGKNKEDKMDGVYIDAAARELNDEAEIEAAIEIRKKRPELPKFVINAKDDVTGAAVWRIYKAEPKTFSKRADDTKQGQAVTVRQPVNLS